MIDGEAVERDRRRRAEPGRGPPAVLDEEVLVGAASWDLDCGRVGRRGVGELEVRGGLDDDTRDDPAQLHAVERGEVVGRKRPAVGHDCQGLDRVARAVDVDETESVADLVVEVAGVAADDAVAVLAVAEVVRTGVLRGTADQVRHARAVVRRHEPHRVDDAVPVVVEVGDDELLLRERDGRIAERVEVRVRVLGQGLGQADPDQVPLHQLVAAAEERPVLAHLAELRLHLGHRVEARSGPVLERHVREVDDHRDAPAVDHVGRSIRRSAISDLGIEPGRVRMGGIGGGTARPAVTSGECGARQRAKYDPA